MTKKTFIVYSEEEVCHTYKQTVIAETEDQAIEYARDFGEREENYQEDLIEITNQYAEEVKD